ncbi:hypothetical protein Tco_1554726 [Tanacetum coccineum]
MLFYLIMNLCAPFGVPLNPKRYYKDGDCVIMLRRPRYEELEYTDSDIADFESRLERIYSREIYRAQRSNSETLPSDDGTQYCWEERFTAGRKSGAHIFGGQFIARLAEHFGLLTAKILGGLTVYSREIHRELILEFLSTLRFGEVLLDFDAPGLHTGEEIESLVFARTSPFLHFDQRSDSETLPSDDGTRRFTAGRKSEAHISGGQFIARLAEHFGLLTAEILRGLTVITPELQIIDMAELVRLQIYVQLDDTWAWVAIGGVPAVAEDAPAVDEGDQAVLAPVHAP